MATYAEFLREKTQLGGRHGFPPIWIPDSLYPFQRSLVGWSILKGRGSLLESCGLGKTAQQLVWADNVVRKTNKPVLILTPLAVAAQTVREGEKFGVDCRRSLDGKVPSGARVIVANYDRLHMFDPKDFSGCVGDEAGCLKSVDAQRTAEVTEFMRTLPYRLLATATPAPNDYVELGTESECLGEMGFQDMATKFFRKTTSVGHIRWSRTVFTMRPHAEKDFWRWVCSWARAVRKPSDLGFEDGEFQLPPLEMREHIVKANVRKPGLLFDMPAVTLEEQREERRRTIRERCEKAAELIGKKRSSIAWCHLNSEGDLLEKLIPGSVQVSGSDPDEEKEEKLMAFISGQARVLVSKPILAGYGLNLQHCAHQTLFPSHSYQEAHQAVRRSWRFGQKKKVVVDMIASEGEEGVLANLNRKAAAAEVMYEKLVRLMNDHLTIERENPFIKPVEIPAWL